MVGLAKARPNQNIIVTIQVKRPSSHFLIYPLNIFYINDLPVEGAHGRQSLHVHTRCLLKGG